MEYKFLAEIKAVIEISDSDFKMLLEQSANHYDHTVQSASMVGGFLYGFHNRRLFSKGEDKKIELSTREMGLILKSLELNNSNNCNRLGRSIHKILQATANKAIEINDIFTFEEVN